MNQQSEGTILLIILGVLAYYLVSTGWLSDGQGHIDKAKLGSEIKKYTVEQLNKLGDINEM